MGFKGLFQYFPNKVIVVVIVVVHSREQQHEKFEAFMGCQWKFPIS